VRGFHGDYRARSRRIIKPFLQRGGNDLKKVTVCVVDYVHKVKTPIGSMVERRQADRGDNLTGLLKMARKRYASTPDSAFRICLEKY
jgi:hypothetical protein